MQCARWSIMHHIGTLMLFVLLTFTNSSVVPSRSEITNALKRHRHRHHHDVKDDSKIFNVLSNFRHQNPSKVLIPSDEVLRKFRGVQPSSDPETEPPCPSCITPVPKSEEEKRHIDQLRIEAIKVQILSKLGLREKPEINSSAIPREMVLEALRRAEPSFRNDDNGGSSLFTPGMISPSSIPSDSDDDPDNYYGRTSEVFTFAEAGGLLNGKTVLKFAHMHDNPDTLQVRKATLWLSFRFKSTVDKKMKASFYNHKVTIYVFSVNSKKLSRRINNDKSSTGINVPTHRLGKHMKLLASHKLRMRHMGWKRLDITKAVKEWFSGNKTEKLNLFVDCTGCGTLIEPVAVFKNGDNVRKTRNYISHRRRNHRRRRKKKAFRPFIVIETEPLRTHRIRKRSAECDGSMTRCCKQTLYVNFKQLKWNDWIIYPRGYYANYCMGSCSQKGLSPDSYINYHSFVMEEYRIHNPYASIKPCCAPRKLSPISLIYFDKEYNIIKTDLRDMSVDECGCT
ncbi:INHBB (predicted) [Pycnogonum litorale]